MISLRRGRAKTVRAVWYQGAAGTSPRIDATGATCSVLEYDLAAPPTISTVSLEDGEFDIVFGTDCTDGLKPGDLCTATIVLDFPSGPSPDPVDIPVAIL